MDTIADQDPELAKAPAAMLRAARAAREVARRYGTPLIIWRDGQVVRVPPGDLIEDREVAAPAGGALHPVTPPG
jgi:hypothetical protein